MNSQNNNVPFDMQSMSNITNSKKLTIKLTNPANVTKRVREIPESFQALKSVVKTTMSKRGTFMEKLINADAYSITYKDECGDVINLSDDEDLMTAYEVAEQSLGNQLKLNVIPRNNDDSALEQSFNSSIIMVENHQAQAQGVTEVQKKIQDMQISPEKKIEENEPAQIVEQIKEESQQIQEEKVPELSDDMIRSAIKETLADQISSDSSDSDNDMPNKKLKGAEKTDELKKLAKERRQARKAQRIERRRKLKEANSGLPRKVFKKLIKKELEKQKTETLNQLMNCREIGEEKDINDFNDQQANQVVHANVECDGCGMNPIVGVRYKCSVQKNFDYCSMCEERRPHEYPFLKITRPEQCPKAMFTIIDDNLPNAQADLEQNINSTFFRNLGPTGEQIGDTLGQFFKGFFGGEGHCGNKWGKGGRWRNGCQGKRQHWQRGGENGPRCPWKIKRAEIVSGVPTDAIPLHIGKTDILKVTVRNDTDWPWKPECSMRNLPYDNQVDQILEPVFFPITDYVAGKSEYTVSIPLTVLKSALFTEKDKHHEATFCFHGKKGKTFGAPITIKFKIVKDVSEHEVYQRASELLENQEFSKFQFEEICNALIMCSMDQGQALEFLVKEKTAPKEQPEKMDCDTENKIDI